MVDSRQYFIPGTLDFIDGILKRNNLRAEERPSAFARRTQGKKHRYATVVRDAQDSRFMFYARLHNNEDAKNKFKREVNFLHELATRHFALKKFTPEITAYSLTKNREWFIREYVAVPVLGNKYVAETRLTVHDVPRFLKMFGSLQTMPHLGDKENIETRNADFIINSVEGNLRAIASLFSPHEINTIKNYFHRSYGLLNRHGLHYVHGDCHPGNMLMDKKQLLVIDWEIIHKSIRTDDIAFFYTSLETAPAFRRALIQKFYKSIAWKQEWRQLFPLSVIMHACNTLYTLIKHQPSYISKKQRKESIIFSQGLVKKAVNGYTYLELF